MLDGVPLLPEMPLASSLTESALFVFAEGGVVRFVPLGSDEGRTCKLSGLDGTGANSPVLEYRGLYFIMQPGAIPLLERLEQKRSELTRISNACRRPHAKL